MVTIGRDAEIAPPILFSGWNDRIGILRFFKHIRRETMRQMMLADHDLDVHTEIVFVAENLDHSPAWILRRRRPVGDFDIDHDIFQVVPGGASRRLLPQHSMRALLALQFFDCLRRLCFLPSALGILHPLGYHDLLRDLLVDRSYEVVPASVVKLPYHGRMRPSDQAHDSSFGAAIGTNVANFHDDAIAMHRRSHRWGRNKNVSHQARFQAFVERVGFRNDEAEAIAVHAQTAHGHVLAGGSLRNRVTVRTDLLKLTRGHQLFEAFEQLAAGVSMNSQFAQQLLEAGSVFGLALDLLQDDGIGKHGRR